MWRVPGSQTPPTPVLEESTYEMYQGLPGLSSSTDVGRLETCWSNVAQSFNACDIEGVMIIDFGSPCIALYSGEQSPFPAGIPIAA